MEMFDSFRNHIADVHAELKRIEFVYSSLVKEIEDLESSGVLKASASWKEGKYLILVHPFGAFTKNINGVETPYRKREYVGLASDKTVEALEKIERYSVWCDLINEKNELSDRIGSLNYRIERFLGEMKWLKKKVDKA